MTQRLPVPLTPLIGREHELANLENILRRTPARLVTITGPGGIGKTRLALELAHRLTPHFPAGCIWVSLASVHDPAEVASALASSLDIQAPAGSTPFSALCDDLAQRNALLVIDNFEQVSAAGPLLTDLLQAGRSLRIVVTSRSVLNVTGEHRVAVDPLALPGTQVDARAVAELAAFPAIRLFVERANAATGDFALSPDNAADVVAVCRALDGLPLAIELAAARLRHLPLAAITARLTDRFGLLVDGPRDRPTRHQALHDAIDWSYKLLSSPAQALFRRMAALPGGCTLATARMLGLGEHQTELETLERISALLDGSLLVRLADPLDEPRYGMLETIRQFGLQQLRACDEEGDTYRALGAGYAGLADRAWEAIGGPEQKPWVDRLDAERGNVRAVCEWAIQANEPGIVLRLRTILWLIWAQRGNLAEGRALLQRALAHPGPIDEGQRANALFDLGNLAFELHDFAVARAAFTECYEVWERTADRDGIANALNGLGLLDRETGAYPSASARFQGAREIWASLHNAAFEALALFNLGTVEIAAGNTHTAHACFSEVLALRRSLNDIDGSAYATLYLGHVASLDADLDQANALLGASLAMFTRLGDRSGEAFALYVMAYCDWLAEDEHKALKRFHEALSLWHALASADGIVVNVEGIAAVAATRGDATLAARLLAATEAYRARIGIVPRWIERRLIETAWAALMNRLDATGIDEARRTGAALSLDEAALAALRLLTRSADDVPVSVLEKLSARERDVFVLLAEYRTDREIAERLFLSHRTVERHVGSILAKLEVKNRREAAALGSTRRTGEPLPA
ncbi:MAG: tetratricopeptide repeat protein [Chloroflexia bacterium]|nr:tetratricopeptide repeat protein [Chloroflexia bacterium]